jgi:CheY-like chemotaxis protein
MLTLARRGVDATEVVNLNDIIFEYLKSPEHEKLKLYHPGVEIETNIESDLLNISGSSFHLSKIVLNLVSNAAEAMPDGGKIFISAENRYLDRPISGYDSVKECDYVTLMVSDTGIGISKKDLERIFEPFYTKKVMGRSGTGLGMAVIWGTVKDHKGYIDVQSTEGKGSTFTLYFPANREKITREECILAVEDYMGKGESILVIDDVKGQRELATILLTTLGYSVHAVSSGEEAVEYLKEHSVDLIVLDMIMDPGMDGLETYKKIIKFHPRQKAIIVSGFSETDRVKEAQKLGVGAYVKKPYTLENIGISVRDELSMVS